MIDRQALLVDLQKLLARLEADLLERSESADVPDVERTLRAEHERARSAERTAQNYEDWRSDYVTQAAAAWVLSCVFVRFLEDNALIEPPRISGPGERLQRARDEHEVYFQHESRRGHTDRDYLLHVFDDLAQLPGAKDLFGEHNALRDLPSWLSGDAAGELLRFFQKIDAGTGALAHDFTDAAWDTRFLGDLYQDLSEAARKRYALLQTPEFVEEFILDRTLDPALDEFGLVIGHWSFVTDQSPPQNTNDKRSMTNDLFRMIDPACGSGHFLLGAFRRILDRWQRQEPATPVRELVRRTLSSIHGVDLNPFAIAIARFRMLLAALRVCGITKLRDAPAFEMNLACGDSLLHAPLRVSGTEGQTVFDWELTSDDAECEHAYPGEDLPALKRMLRSGQYHAVVANPPYITPKDRQLNERYRRRFESCHMKYSLAVPFMERVFRLAVPASEPSGSGGMSNTPEQPLPDGRGPGGFTGQITANSFMKREFGRKLIDTFLPQIDLTHVIDTSGAYIPGHGTPTVILFGRHRLPVAGTVRAVMGIRGEPSTPDDPTRGLVWSAIVGQIDQPGSQSEFVSVADSERDRFHSHPWSIAGGGAAELKERLEEGTTETLSTRSESIGITSFTLEDDIYILPECAARRSRLRKCDLREMVVGDALRDWTKAECEVAVFPYDANFRAIEDDPNHPSLRYLWMARTGLSNNKMFGGETKVESGLKWYEYGRLTSDKLRTPLSIVYGEVATHNHFVLDRGGKVFKQTAPVIKLPETIDEPRRSGSGAAEGGLRSEPPQSLPHGRGSGRPVTEDDHLALLGLLNSSTACFWLKQVCHNKGSTVDQHGARQRTAPFEDFFAFNATKLQQFPLPDGRPLEFARRLDSLAQQLAENAPRAAIARWCCQPNRDKSLWQMIDDARGSSAAIRGQMILLQEDLDWQCYRLYGLVDEALTIGQDRDGAGHSIRPGMRAFEILLARELAAGKTQTTWFDRHGIEPWTDLPGSVDPNYSRVVDRRIEIILRNPQVALIEQPEYKRRWHAEIWGDRLEEALRDWLLDRLESCFDFDGRMTSFIDRAPPEDLNSARALTFNFSGPDIVVTFDSPVLARIELVSVARLADVAGRDADFMEVARLYRDDPAFDVQKLVAELVEAESVPLLPVLRYKVSGLRKRAAWEQTWELQRAEDRLEAQRKSLEQQIRERLDELVAEHGADLRRELDELRPRLESERRAFHERWHADEPYDEHTPPDRRTSFPSDPRYVLQRGRLEELRERCRAAESGLERLRATLQQQDEAIRRLRAEIDDFHPPPQIDVPPKYKSSDFISTGGARYWALRGKLDVPKERWVSFPHCEGPDGTLVIAWAGYDHVQLARAISSWYVEIQERLGGRDDPRLVPLLAGLIELLPWLKQWHNEPDPAFDGLRMGDYFEGFIQDEARQMGKTVEEIRAWAPPARTGRRGRRTAT